MRIIPRAALLALPLTLLAAASLAHETAPAKRVVHLDDVPILGLIGKLEGPAGYDDFYNASPVRPPSPISDMTIGQVLEFQDRAVAAGSRSSAAGRFQFIRGTLRDLVAKGLVTEHARFDARTQNYLARIMLARCGFYDPARGAVEIGNCLSGVWAALPVMSGRNAGRSYYSGVAGNRALTTTAIVARAIESRSRQPQLDARPIPVDARGSRPAVRQVRTAANFPDDGRISDRIPLR